MGDQKISAESRRAHQFVMKRLNGADAQDAFRRSEIDQIIAVNDERAEAQFDAAISETLRACVRDVSNRSGRGSTFAGWPKRFGARWRLNCGRFRATT